MGESDSEDSEGDDSDAEKEKSVVTENGNQSDSSKDASSASVSILPSDGRNHSGSSESGSEEEKDMVTEGTSGVAAKPSGCNEKISASAEVVSISDQIVVEQGPSEHHSEATIVAKQLLTTTNLVEPDGPQSTTTVPELDGVPECKAVSPDEGNIGSSNAPEVLLQPLNLADFNSANELEVGFCF